MRQIKANIGARESSNPGGPAREASRSRYAARGMRAGRRRVRCAELACACGGRRGRGVAAQHAAWGACLVRGKDCDMATQQQAHEMTCELDNAWARQHGYGRSTQHAHDLRYD